MLFFWVVEENESQICKLQLLNKERERERVLKVGGPHQCLSILIFLISLRVLGWLLACKRELRNMWRNSVLGKWAAGEDTAFPCWHFLHSILSPLSYNMSLLSQHYSLFLFPFYNVNVSLLLKKQFQNMINPLGCIWFGLGSMNNYAWGPITATKKETVYNFPFQNGCIISGTQFFTKNSWWTESSGEEDKKTPIVKEPTRPSFSQFMISTWYTIPFWGGDENRVHIQCHASKLGPFSAAVLAFSWPCLSVICTSREKWVLAFA